MEGGAVEGQRAANEVLTALGKPIAYTPLRRSRYTAA